VVRKDTAANNVFISRNYYAHDKPRNHCAVDRCNWLRVPNNDSALRVKLRHGPTMYACTIAGSPTDTLQVTLANHDQGIAPGQFAVFYEDGICLGAGIII
jgi:tRNA U34 2-thiouridine synthase MnmA/TrmU